MKLKDGYKCCQYCGKAYNPRNVKRILGKESSPVLLGYCSAKCYTDAILNKKANS